jgi:predicted choloylglycine hydrolase
MVVATANALPVFTYNGSSHYDLGFQMGSQFKSAITARFNDTLIRDWLLPYVQSDAGQPVYNHFVELHKKVYPDYMEELEGLAKGCQLSFMEVFTANMEVELSYFAPNQKGRKIPDHCSDYALHTNAEMILGHNEDSGPSDYGNTFLAKVSMPGSVSWTAYVYAGNLPTGGWGFNERGFAFTLNYVAPLNSSANGVGRAFTGRDVLESIDMDDALRRITGVAHCVGHNYQLLYTNATVKMIAQVEVGPGVNVSETKVVARCGGSRGGSTDKSTYYFHANTYQFLDIPYYPDESSAARLRRVAQLPPPVTDTDVMGMILGDQFNKSYPIFHDAAGIAAGDLSGDLTLGTVSFDLLRCQVRLWEANPRSSAPTMVLTYPHCA